MVLPAIHLLNHIVVFNNTFVYYGNMQKKINVLLLLVAFIFFLLILLGIWVFANNQKRPDKTASFEQSKALESTNVKTYVSQKYGYSFKYPKNWDISLESANNGLKSGENVTLINERGISIMSIDTVIRGIGCQSPLSVTEGSFIIGETNVKQDDFCGTKRYFIDGTTHNGVPIQIAIYYMESSPGDDLAAREVLKSIENIIVKLQ